MKNPMDRQLEKQLSDRAVAIGREGNAAALGELLELLKSSSANARRLAASALGKLAWMGVDQETAVAALAPVARCDPHAQTRQYAIKALKTYGAAAHTCLSDLRDMTANPAEKDYIRRDTASAVAFIEEALHIAKATAEHRCQRCNTRVPADLPRLGALLPAKLRLFGYTVGVDERSEVSQLDTALALRASETKDEERAPL